MMSSDLTTYTQLCIQHFSNAVSRCTHLPIPAHLRNQVAAIFILHNPQFPNHFLNGCYVILHPGSESSCVPRRVRQLLSLLGTGTSSDSLEDGSLLASLSRSTFLKPHLPLRLCSRILGCPPELTIPQHLRDTWASEGTSLVMSITPTPLDRLRAFVRCYATLLRSNSRIRDGAEYFVSTFPAKANIVHHETTFAWICQCRGRQPGLGATNNNNNNNTNTNDSNSNSNSSLKPIGYIQFAHLTHDSDEGALQHDVHVHDHVLITGLAIEEDFEGADLEVRWCRTSWRVSPRKRFGWRWQRGVRLQGTCMLGVDLR